VICSATTSRRLVGCGRQGGLH